MSGIMKKVPSGSILERYSDIDPERFEGFIAVGRTLHQICVAFDVDEEEMDAWCRKQYGFANAKTAYGVLQQLTVKEYLDTIHDLGVRGNPTALQIMDRAIQKDESSQAARIEFTVAMPMEGKDDKEASD